MIRSRKHYNPTVDMLARMPLFAGCSRRQLKDLGYFADQARLPSGYNLLRQGEISRECFILIDGEVEVRVDGLVVAAVGANSLIGAQSMLRRTRRTCSITTTVDTRLFAFGTSGFWQLMDVPHVGRHVRSAASAVPECLHATPLVVPTQPVAAQATLAPAR